MGMIFVSHCMCSSIVFVFFKQKTAYEMRISDWSSDVCSSDLQGVCCCLRRDAVRPHKCLGGLRGGDHIAPRGESEDRHRASFEKIGRASCRERVCQYV